MSKVWASAMSADTARYVIAQLGGLPDKNNVAYLRRLSHHKTIKVAGYSERRQMLNSLPDAAKDLLKHGVVEAKLVNEKIGEEHERTSLRFIRVRPVYRRIWIIKLTEHANDFASIRGINAGGALL